MPDPTMTNPNEPKISFNIKQPEVLYVIDIRAYIRKVRLSQASLPKL